MTRRIEHNHDDGALTIGCPACIAKVREAQEAERWATAPLRRTHWVWATEDGANGNFDVVLRVPDLDPHDGIVIVTERCQHDDAVIAAVNAANAPMHAYWYCADIGPVVPDVTAPAVEHPSLFGGAA